MNRLIDAFEGLFAAATISGGELAETANLILKNVNWAGKPNKPEPVSHQVVDTHLEMACANAGRYGRCPGRC